jgi:hypothetical protein
LTSLTAPIGGVIIGGIVTSKCGGYNTILSKKINLAMGLGAVICSALVPLYANFVYVGILLWFLLFFGGFILPPITGVMINSVSDA